MLETILFYSIYSLILLLALAFLILFFSAVYSFRPKNQLPIVYIYIMIACNGGSIFIEFTTDVFPILLTKNQNEWVYDNIGEYLTLLDSFIYAYPMFLTSIMTCERLYVTLFPTGNAFSNRNIWIYSFWLKIMLIIIILIPFFSECTLNFDFYDIEYTTSCDNEDHILTYALENYTAVIPIISMIVNITLIFQLSSKRKKFIQEQNYNISRVRENHERLLMIQVISTTTFLLLYEITEKLTDIFEREYKSLPNLERRAVYYTRTSFLVFTCFFIYYVGTPSIRRIINRKVFGMCRRTTSSKTIKVKNGHTLGLSSANNSR